MKLNKRLSKWLLQDLDAAEGRDHQEHPDKAPWWKVMCLTGVDYFSTLGYQPSIAFLAAGLLSPIATLILIAVTLFAALPTYKWVAEHSPHGQGSISMLEHLLPGWRSKLLVLLLLGFAGMGFIITITLSSADAAAHVVENPLIGPFLSSRMLVTMGLLALLGGIFLKGFKEVIGLAVVLVGAYLGLNTILLVVGLVHIALNPAVVFDWWTNIFAVNPSVMDMLVLCVLVFPRLALGLSGFETGVMVMPLVEGGEADKEVDEEGKPLLKGRIANTKKLLTTAALIMSVLLMMSSIVTSLLIPAEVLQEGGAADGRALAWLAHNYLGHWFGTAYDISTVAILWFAGASAMAGLVNLVPRYLPRYGMAPQWARAVRPLVLVFTGVCVVVTYLFGADVHSQSSAYATGVLVFLTAAAFAVTMELWQMGWVKRVLYSCVTLVFVYTTAANVIDQPSGVKVAGFFLVSILLSSIVSRVWRATELRVSEIKLDEQAETFLADYLAKFDRINLAAHRSGGSPYSVKIKEMSYKHNVPSESILLVEVKVSDSSDFDHAVVEVRGVLKGEGDHPMLVASGPAVSNVLAALTLHIRDRYEKIPDLYFAWSEGHPFEQAVNYVLWGEGEIALLTREVLRVSEPDSKKRPKVHVA
ncbi:MAG: amino acid transporter [Candidatus Obscuribacterales bacterium]